jgi:photosystem II oxygen-evolving enhancer protein 1
MRCLHSIEPSPSQAANALTFDELQGLTYLQVKGSGLANTCPVLSTGSTNLKDLKSGSYKLERFCMEPTAITVKEDSQFKGGDTNFVATKLMTRLTYTLDAVSTGGCDGRLWEWLLWSLIGV